MTRADALRDLLAAVEAGKLPPDDTIADTLDQFFPHAYSTLTPEFCGAFGGSVDAAIAFTETVLPGWRWKITDLPDALLEPPRDLRHIGQVYPDSMNSGYPARALFIAALKALIAQEEANA